MSDGTYRLTDTEWREYQNIPEQGYSHRAWIDHKIAERLQAAATEHPIRAKRVWDSGYAACEDDVHTLRNDWPAYRTPNPYRSVNE